MKTKNYIVFLIAIIILLLLGLILINLTTKSNYDIKIITDSGGSFFISTSSYKEYYLVNSCFGIKIPTEEFTTKNTEISKSQIQQLEELSKIDNNFNLNDFYMYNQINNIFFYDNLIFYTIGNNKNLYKYNIDTKEVELLEVQSKNYNVNIKLEALTYIYPNLKEAILNKTKKNFLYDIYYDNGRILFSTGYSSNKSKNYYLFEYNPKNSTTKRIAHTTSCIVYIDIIK